MLGEKAENDPRVLKAQLALAADSARAIRLTSPVWAAVIAILSSIGVFGQVSFAQTIFLPLAVAVSCGIGALMAGAYQRYGEKEGSAKSWFHWFMMVQAASSAAWYFC